MVVYCDVKGNCRCGLDGGVILVEVTLSSARSINKRLAATCAGSVRVSQAHVLCTPYKQLY
jgi:hypothetical protein